MFQESADLMGCFTCMNLAARSFNYITGLLNDHMMEGSVFYWRSFVHFCAMYLHGWLFGRLPLCNRLYDVCTLYSRLLSILIVSI